MKTEDRRDGEGSYNKRREGRQATTREESEEQAIIDFSRRKSERRDRRKEKDKRKIQ